MTRRPNLLFITTDHQRADSLGMVQAGVEVTPNLNQLAAEGAVFTRAYTTSPLCVPARTALATGKYPTRNGVVFNDWQGKRAGDHPTIHQFFAEAGYELGHVGVHHIKVKPALQERVTFPTWLGNEDYAHHLTEQGIDDTPAQGRDFFQTDVLERQDGDYVNVAYSNARSSVWPHEAEHFKDSVFCQKGIDFIKQIRDTPFALFVNLWAPHPPLRVPEPYFSMFDPDKLNLPPNIGVPAKGEPANRRRGIAAQLADGVSMDEWRRAWAAHLGLVRLADEGIGWIIEALEATGQMNNTLIVFMSDHGDHLGQHSMYQKMEMYEEAIRTPLIIHGPGIQAGTFTQVVSHLDVLPTLLDFVGIPLPEGLDGLSLANAIYRDTSLPDRAAFSQYSGNPTVGDIRRVVITQRYKYIYDPEGGPELYDLELDPLEMNNLAKEESHVEIRRDLHETSRAWAENHDDWVSFPTYRSSRGN